MYVDNEATALVGTQADNTAPHFPIGGPFQREPNDEATVTAGSYTVFADNAGVARSDDNAVCCDHPQDDETGSVVSLRSSIFAG